jgi:hypothetical protein
VEKEEDKKSVDVENVIEDVVVCYDENYVDDEIGSEVNNSLTKIEISDTSKI